MKSNLRLLLQQIFTISQPSSIFIIGTEKEVIFIPDEEGQETEKPQPSSERPITTTELTPDPENAEIKTGTASIPYWVCSDGVVKFDHEEAVEYQEGVSDKPTSKA